MANVCLSINIKILIKKKKKENKISWSVRNIRLFSQSLHHWNLWQKLILNAAWVHFSISLIMHGLKHTSDLNGYYQHEQFGLSWLSKNTLEN